MVFITLFTTLFIRCSEDDDKNNTETGQITLKLTDAPSDDAEIKGTFVTISDVKIDGESLEAFSKQTIEISAYQQGETKLLISNDINAESYSSISLVFDYESDESGNSPGCYVLTNDNQKHNLVSQSQSYSEITFSNEFDVQANTNSSWVVDFNMRKAITRNNESSTESNYKFVSTSEMQNALRIVDEDSSGEVHGEVTETLNTDDEMYVYIYRKGEFNTSTETQEQGNSDILFANAVTSAKVNENGSYKLAFLEEGDYEIHVASYNIDNEQKSEFSTMLNAESVVSGLLLNDISVNANTDIAININILGII